MEVKNKGITLMALVITIIILLILVGIVIYLSIGENGIIRKSQYAKETYLNAQRIEEEQLNELDRRLANGDYAGTSSSEFNKYLNERLYPEGIPLIPQMTSDECSIGKVTYSSVKNNRVGYKAFDKIFYFGDKSTYNDEDNTWQTDDNGENYIQFEFHIPVVVKSIKFVPSYVSTYGGLALKTAKLLLSNDGENFIEASELMTYENNLNNALQFQTIESNDTTNQYKYVRLYVNGAYTSSYGTGIAIREMQIFGWFEK